MAKNIMEKKNLNLSSVFSTIFRIWKRETLKRLFSFRHLAVHMFRAKRTRKRIGRKEGLLVPTAIALSPTSNCNLDCFGCYSRSHPMEGQLTIETIDRCVGEAVECGVFLFVITGGEPFLLKKMAPLYKKYARALFLVITNGTLITPETADEIAESGNVIPVVSVEGDEKMTDRRRGEGVYNRAMRAMELFRDRKVLFGFSAVCTDSSIDCLGSETFVDRMVEAGCTLGFYNELIPLREGDETFLPKGEQRTAFKEQLIEHRRAKPIVLINLPEDEYDEAGYCMAVGRGAMHINSQGWAEPCPFAHYAGENINTHSFRDLLRSPFFKALRDHPTALMHGDIGCSLVSNREVLREIAAATGALPTSDASRGHVGEEKGIPFLA
jgi:MoaA/NifB/PqqE/SkfB family radical SAM enzyme